MKFLTPESFVKALFEPAKACEVSDKIPYIFTIAQAAIESGWGKAAIGNNLFGIKADKSWKGKKILITTTEWHADNTHVYPETISIEKVGARYKYIVKDWFRDYDTLEEGLADHGKFLTENKRYAKAFQYTDPERFALEVAVAGYATAPDYYYQLLQVMKSVRKRLPL